MTPSPDEAGFLKAIADNPADETARLAYADWLSDRGDPWAVFVRASADFLRAVRELGDLRRAHPPEWLEVLDPLFNRIRLAVMSWQHTDGETVVRRFRIVPGEFVRRGQVLVELESDRMAEEVVADEPGVIVALLCRESDAAPFGCPLVAYVRLPVEVPLPPPPLPVVPLREFIRSLEARRAALQSQGAEQINAEFDRTYRAAAMVFGQRSLSRLAVIARRHPNGPGVWVPNVAGKTEQALERLDTLIEVLRALLATHGQPTGFAELPELSAD
ncbi:MAG: TIGR02996 domain-containing protein [Gemmataceae bacterium]|nr:TIGR02996 domain-containing protein [Gemmataceae bacterium]